jgi:hypothetical protein
VTFNAATAVSRSRRFTAIPLSVLFGGKITYTFDVPVSSVRTLYRLLIIDTGFRAIICSESRPRGVFESFCVPFCPQSVLI